MLRQLKEKFLVTSKEMMKWTALQDQLLESIYYVITDIKKSGSLREIAMNGTGKNHIHCYIA